MPKKIPVRFIGGPLDGADGVVRVRVERRVAVLYGGDHLKAEMTLLYPQPPDCDGVDVLVVGHALIIPVKTVPKRMWAHVYKLHDVGAGGVVVYHYEDLKQG